MTQKSIVFHFCFFVSWLCHGLTIISDLDDTIKITHVKNLKGLYHATLDDRVFIGMPELFRSFKASAENKLYVVSGSYRIVGGPVAGLLQRNGIDVDGVHLTGGSSKKPASIRRLMEKNHDDVILLGDDQEKDPYFYQQIKELFPDRIKAIYIHQLNIKQLPAGQIPFYSAYEVAAHEVSAGRLSESHLEKVKNSIQEVLDLKPGDPYITRRMSNLLIPDWQNCDRESVQKVLNATRAFDFVDKEFLNRLGGIAVRNCDD
jgi:hypothetical protein